MNDHLRVARDSIGHRIAVRRSDDFCLRALVSLGNQASAANFCCIGYDDGLRIAAAAEPRDNGTERRVEAWIRAQRSRVHPGEFEYLEGPGLPLAGYNNGLSGGIVGGIASRDCVRAAAIVGASLLETDQHCAFLQLLSNLTLERLCRERAERETDQWRAQLGKSHKRVAAAESSGKRLQNQIESSKKILEQTGSRSTEALARVLAGCGPFKAWIVCATADGTTRVVASANVDPASIRFRHSALVECQTSGNDIVRHAYGTARIYDEDRLFGRSAFPNYVCLPLGVGAIGLGTAENIDDELRERMHISATAAAPVFANLVLRQRLANASALNRDLALRAIGAGIAERGHIARDLHDDLAQILTAAQLAIRAGGSKGKGILRKLEKPLREKIRALRPASIGRGGLSEAIKAQVGRLQAAGLKVESKIAPASDSIPKALQRVCLQIVAEACSNILYHSHATKAQISVGRSGETVQIAITDNGKGLGNAAVGDKSGLRGITERAELLGGRCLIRSRTGKTRLSIEIPEISVL